MKIVILAAGRGKRMGQLTEDLPKPLLEYKGKNLIQHKLDILPLDTNDQTKSISEIIIVIGYLGDKIRETIGDEYKDIPITYVEQREILGTAHALWQCKSLLDKSPTDTSNNISKHITDEPFIVLMADDIYHQEDLEKLIASYTKSQNWSLLAYNSDSKINAGKIIIDSSGNFQEIIEDFEGKIPYTLIYTGACLLTPEIFTKGMVKLSNGEYGLPQTISLFTKEKSIGVIKTKNWKRITSPEDLV